ncbi:hypothetical protein MCGE09_00030 [Thaumarchaeota archaeon SCGC AB-539-E09]|nr:hypothetical protein MCGE09_00030 [Thaumarchaeota archaeon SCGC AB-539-E09]
MKSYKVRVYGILHPFYVDAPGIQSAARTVRTQHPEHSGFIIREVRR